jgi:hypothetical protein
MLQAFDGRPFGAEYLVLSAGAEVSLLPPVPAVDGGGWAEVSAEGRRGWVPLAFLGR